MRLNKKCNHQYDIHVKSLICYELRYKINVRSCEFFGGLIETTADSDCRKGRLPVEIGCINGNSHWFFHKTAVYAKDSCNAGIPAQYAHDNPKYAERLRQYI